jgi:hypothetical protein
MTWHGVRLRRENLFVRSSARTASTVPWSSLKIRIYPKQRMMKVHLNCSEKGQGAGGPRARKNALLATGYAWGNLKNVDTFSTSDCF